MKEEELITYFDNIASERSKWKKRNWYYYKYLNNLINFLVPPNKKVLRVEVGDSLFWKVKPSKEETFDYVVVTDILSYVGDVQGFMESASKRLKSGGRIVISQYNALWEPMLRLASKIGLRMPSIEQNWLSMHDLKNFASLADLEVIKSGTKMIFPKYIPLLSSFLNKFVANIFPFSRLGLFHYLVLRRKEIVFSKKETAVTKDHLPSLSIIVPARNEEGTIEKIVRELPELGSFTEIIFIESNSVDNTYEEIIRVAEKYKNKRKIKYAKQEGGGKGDAVRKGFDMAEGNILAIYDADMTVPAEEMQKFYWAIVENRGEFINGSRLVYPLEKESMRVLNLFANKFFSFVFSAILGQPLKDTLCGTKVIWEKDYEDIKNNRHFFGDFDPFGDFDLLFGAAKLNLKIIDLPIHYQERKYGTTNISRFRHGWLLLKMTVFAARKIKFI